VTLENKDTGMGYTHEEKAGANAAITASGIMTGRLTAGSETQTEVQEGYQQQQQAAQHDADIIPRHMTHKTLLSTDICLINQKVRGQVATATSG